MSISIAISPIIAAAAPDLRVIAIEADVTNKPTSEALWTEIQDEASHIVDAYAMADINKRLAIAATRAAYKALGKEPNRYRPSAEALCRRVVKGLGLYRINALVDAINLLSMRSGYSIGGFDADLIDGTTLTLGRGEADEPFEGIGRGQLNIEGLPVYRDATGGIGTPTSDNERTKLSLDTRRLLMCINVYGIELPIDDTVTLATRLLNDYADAGNISVTLVKA